MNGVSTIAWLGVLSPPRNDATPITPSLPVTAYSADARFSATQNRETMPAVRKYTYFSRSPAP